MKKKAFALLLCILICLGMLPISAFAENDTGFTITIVIDGKKENTSGGTVIPSSGKYELNKELNLPGFNDDCFYGWYEGDHVVGSVYLGMIYGTVSAGFSVISGITSAPFSMGS